MATRIRIPKIRLDMAGWPGIWFAAYPVIYALLARRRNLDAYSAVDFSAIGFIAYTLVALYMGLSEFFGKNRNNLLTLLTRSNLGIFLLFTIWGGVTTIWSVNPVLSFYRSLECLSFFLLILAVVHRLCRDYGPIVLIQWILKWYVSLSVTVNALRYISWGMLSQVFTCSQMTVTVFVFLSVFHDSSALRRGMAILFSIFSGSTTAYVGMAAGTCGLWLGNSRKKLLALLVLLCVVGGIAHLGTYVFFKDTVFSQRSDISFEHSSGRNYIWKYMWSMGNRRPWGGWGFFAGEPFLLYQYYNGAINCHNAILSSFIGTGYIGMILLIAYILSYIPYLVKKERLRKYRSAMAGCYAAALAHCISNPGIGSRVYGSWTSVMVLFVMISVMVFFSKKVVFNPAKRKKRRRRRLVRHSSWRLVRRKYANHMGDKKFPGLSDHSL